MNLLRAMAVAAVLCLIAGCDWMPGKPRLSDLPIRPSDVEDFARLYSENCSGCHGAKGEFGPAFALDNPVFQGLVDDDILTRIVSQGLPGTKMPAFAQEAGGFLTSEQVGILVTGMRRRWQPSQPLQNAPPYAADGPGDEQRGAAVFAQSCAPCHASDGGGGPKAPGSIVDGSYLMLVSDQALRTLVIAGRPDLGHPDWRGYPPGGPLTAQQVTDVVAWLAAKRPRYAPGRYVRNP
jgi:mono/diheme cytochrome c family protein